MNMKLGFKKLRHDAIVPTRGSQYSSGLDMYAVEHIFIPPESTVKVSTGIAFDIPNGCEIQIRPRSGLSAKTGLRVANTPGTIDKDYTGSCDILLHNTSKDEYVINRGDRIAQAVLCPVFLPELEEVTELETTERGSNGFGSSGV